MHNEILLAEDSRDVQIVFRNTLKKCGVVNPLVTLEDGHATVAYLNGDPPFKDRGKNGVPGVLFLDLNMPDSEEVLNWIQNRPGGKEGVLVIVMSPLDSVGEVSHAYELGADTFLSEPFTPPRDAASRRHVPRPMDSDSARRYPQVVAASHQLGTRFRV